MSITLLEILAAYREYSREETKDKAFSGSSIVCTDEWMKTFLLGDSNFLFMTRLEFQKQHDDSEQANPF